MNTKLTLTIKKEVIQKANKYAKQKKQSLSDIIENYLKAITRDVVNEEIEMTPLVKSLKGSFKAPIDFDYKIELTDVLSDKYLNP